MFRLMSIESTWTMPFCWVPSNHALAQRSFRDPCLMQIGWVQSEVLPRNSWQCSRNGHVWWGMPWRWTTLCSCLSGQPRRGFKPTSQSLGNHQANQMIESNWKTKGRQLWGISINKSKGGTTTSWWWWLYHYSWQLRMAIRCWEHVRQVIGRGGTSSRLLLGAVSAVSPSYSEWMGKYPVPG